MPNGEEANDNQVGVQRQSSDREIQQSDGGLGTKLSG